MAMQATATSGTASVTAELLAALGGPQRIAVIGGSSLLSSALMSALAPLTVPTSRGPVVVHAGPQCVFVQRHKCVFGA